MVVKRVISLLIPLVTAGMIIPAPAAQATTRDVTAFGAVANDSGDDTAAFQAAMNASAAGDTVTVPSGTFVINGALTPKSVTTLAGSPTGWSIITGGGTIGNDSWSVAVNRFTMRDLMIRGVDLHVSGSSTVKYSHTLERMVFVDSRVHYQVRDLKILDSVVLSGDASAKVPGLSLYAATDVRIANNLIGLDLGKLDWITYYWPAAPRWVSPAHRLRVLGQKLGLNRSQGRMASGMYANNATNLKFENNIVNADRSTFNEAGIADHAIYVWGPRNVEVRDNWFRGWPQNASGGVKIRNGDGAVVTGNVLQDTAVITYVQEDPTHPLYLYNVTVCDNLQINTLSQGDWGTGMSYLRYTGVENGLYFFRNTISDSTKRTTINLTNANTGTYAVYNTNRFTDGTVVPVVKSTPAFTGILTTAPPTDRTARCAGRVRPNIPVPAYGS